MTSIQIPEFYSPFPSEVSPYVDEAQKHTVEWAIQFRLVEDDLTLERFQREKSAWLAGRTDRKSVV